MSEHFSPLDFQDLCRWISCEIKNNSIFGIPLDHVARPDKQMVWQRYGQALETPLGVAAGPHTQLSQNIITAWLCGARYMELKTVQILDELTIARPCIDMEDEGYNCEWSQELKLQESLEEYINAWVMLHILRSELFPHTEDSANDTAAPGFIFNMSIGYNLEGILSDPVQRFMQGLRNAGEKIQQKLMLAEEYFPGVSRISISPCVSDNVTLSTMHGCPPDEIEKIASYLIAEAKLHTTVKLNPTLLGPKALRNILNDQLGYTTSVPEEAFAHDLKYPDAVALIERLQKLAAEKEVCFGVKLSNTLESENNRTIFPENEKMMYMSGRGLFPLTTALAAKLTETFGDSLDISYAGGADCWNFSQLVDAGLWPVTVCSDILRPGGYGRLHQYLEELTSFPESEKADPAKVKTLADFALESQDYKKGYYENRNIKNNRSLRDFDCVAAPCTIACPVKQQVPDYIDAAAYSNFHRSQKIIRKDNPVASICAMVCEHPCELNCTRINYDEAVAIRDIKRAVLRSSGDESEKQSTGSTLTAASKELKVGIVGAGPAGIACARELASAGIEVAILEARSEAGGMVDRVIPRYRLERKDIEQDLASLNELGVKIEYNTSIQETSQIRKLLDSRFDFLFFAAGAPEDQSLKIPGEENEQVLGALEFLDLTKQGETFDTKKILVIGGGNSAMDAARSALKLPSKPAVMLLYRRKIEHMPADKEELHAIQEEGVEIVELVQPVSIHKNPNGNPSAKLRINCIKMKLAETDTSGRPKPVPVEDSEHIIEADMLISAVGQSRNWILLEEIGLPIVSDIQAGSLRGTKLDGVFVGGDVLRGPVNVVRAAADGKQAANEILIAAGFRPAQELQEPQNDRSFGEADPGKNIIDYSSWYTKSTKRSRRQEAAKLPLEKREMDTLIIADLTSEQLLNETTRCLQCSDICNVCVSVCPNRANISYRLEPVTFPVYSIKTFTATTSRFQLQKTGNLNFTQPYQTANIVDFCNQCGNCVTFCPSSGAPWRDKTRICLSQEQFESSDDVYYFSKNDAEIMYKNKSEIYILRKNDAEKSYVYETPAFTCNIDYKNLEPVAASLKILRESETDTSVAVKMAVLMTALASHPLQTLKAAQ